MQRNSVNGVSTNKSTATRTGLGGVIFLAVVPLIFFFYCFIVISEYNLVFRHDLSPDAMVFGSIFQIIGVFITCIPFYYLGYIVVRKSSLRAKIILVICLFIFPLVYLVSLVESDRQTLERPRENILDLQSKPTEPYTPPAPSVDLSELSDEEICRAAIHFDEMNDRYTWRPKAFPHIDEAVRRDYTSKDCARLLGLSVEPGTSDLPKPSKAPTPTGALTERSDEDICRSAIHFDEKYKYYAWRPLGNSSFLEEAGRRGYTATKCAELLGFLKN